MEREIPSGLTINISLHELTPTGVDKGQGNKVKEGDPLTEGGRSGRGEVLLGRRNVRKFRGCSIVHLLLSKKDPPAQVRRESTETLNLNVICVETSFLRTHPFRSLFCDVLTPRG